MDQDNPNGFVESERGIILNEPLPEERRSPADPAPKPPKKHEKKIVGFLLFLLIAGAVAFAATQIDYSAISDSIAGANFDASEELSGLISDLELTDDGMRILKATHPELLDADAFNEHCVAQNPNSSVLGCYSNGKIYIYNIKRSELEGIRQSVLAHELLHAVWDRLGVGQRSDLSGPLQSVLRSSELIQKDMENYQNSNSDDELHSRIGTEIALEQLPEALVAHYAKYFKNYSKVVAYYAQYEGVFENLSNELEAMKASIDEQRGVIRVLEQKYTSDYETFSSDLNSYNERRRTPNGFASETEFRAVYESLVSRKKQLEIDYSAIRQKYDALNDLIRNYNKKAVYSNNLQKSMSSTVEKPADNI